MKILVTGANGFVGKHLVEHFIQAGHEVVARRIDITVPFRIKECFDVVVHLAAYNITHVGDADSSIYSRVNIDGTKNVLSGTLAPRFVFLSSTKVYCKSLGIITEDSGIDPQQPYEKSKWEAEQACLSLGAGKELVILRSINAYGPGQLEKAVIPIFFKQAMSNEPIKVFGPRGTWLQFIYIDDLIRAIGQAALTPKVEGVFNVASNQLVRLDELALMIKNICKSSSEILFMDENLEAKIEVSYNKIKEKIGWLPLVTLEDGLHRYYDYAQQST